MLSLLGVAGVFALRPPAPAGSSVPTLTVFAAASTTDALQEIAVAYQKNQSVRIRFNFASSGMLARQLEAGAKADLFISADVRWMDYATEHGLVAPASRRDLLGNRLVLIAPAGSRLQVRMDRSFNLAHALNGRLALGDPESVPAGRYAQQALAALHWEKGVQLLPCADARAALAAVERGEAAAGIVFASDAAVPHNIKVLGEFPESTHAPIRYPAALGKQAAPAATALLEYLSGPEAQRIFSKHGFTVLAKEHSRN
ncbi:MAG: molybdate ABC transporter substrate-binding protein [Armatimonadota bacterium]